MNTNQPLNLKKTNDAELSLRWGFPSYYKQNVYITCNSKGKVLNWKRALIFTEDEIKNKNYRIHET